MNSLLIVSGNQKIIEEEIDKIVKENHAIRSNFSLEKIDDARELKNLSKLDQNQKLAIIIRNIEKASIPALNALLKNIEEPGKNIIFILTAKSIKSVIPTIVSRCQIIKLKYKDEKLNEEETKKYSEFLKQKMGIQLIFVDKIKKREEALEFLRGLIRYCQESLKNQENDAKISRCLLYGSEALVAIKSNGNIKLQLTKMIINL
jgi:DNA polymerase-3 subunit delta'